METFKVAFYKAKFGDKKWIDDGISIYTTTINAIGLCLFFKFKMAWKVIKNRYSHVEVIYQGATCPKAFTSTMRQGMAGTVIRDANGVLIHPERWDIMEISVEKIDLRCAIAWAQWQRDNNKGYNKKTIANFFNPFRPTQKPKNNEPNICSVAVQGFCWQACIFKVWRIWSPIKLWWKLTKLGYKTKPLVQN